MQLECQLCGGKTTQKKSRDKFVYHIESANGFKKVLKQYFDIKPEVVHDHLY